MFERGSHFLPKNRTPQYFPFENTEGSYFLMYHHQTLDFLQCLAFQTDIVRPILPRRHIKIDFPCQAVFGQFAASPRCDPTFGESPCGIPLGAGLEHMDGV